MQAKELTNGYKRRLENNPTVTPIGSLFLNTNQTGFYFEKYPTKLPVNAEENKNICALAVNSNIWFWLNRRMKTSKGMKGNKYLWGDMEFVREIVFTDGEKINLGKMTIELR